MKSFISLSGGVESTTMCLLYGKGAIAIWCDPGDEHREMYERIDFLEKAFQDIHDGDFTLLRINPKVKVKGVEVSTLSDAIRLWKFFPSAQARFCTGSFKIEPIEQFLSRQGECELLIGFNADEEPGVARVGNFEKLENVRYRYPLHEDGYTREDCEGLLRQYGLHPNFPVYMSRGGCKFCFYKSPAEYKAMYILDRETFDEVEALEKEVQDAREKYFSILPHTTFAKIKGDVDIEVENWGVEAVVDMYRPIAKTKVCGAFCHR